MASSDKMIQWMQNRLGKVRYSMSDRNDDRTDDGDGKSFDCSSAVFNALIAGGFLPKGSFIGNTDTLFRMEGKLLQPISRADAKRGDIFVSGKKNASAGSAGHTGIFLSNSTIIHCTYSKGGIAITQAKNWMGDYSGLPVYCYRLKGSSVNPDTSNQSQLKKVAVDGQWGPGTALRLQEYFGTSRDGVISHQWKDNATKNIYAAKFDKTLIGSDVVRAIQRKLGVRADGLLGYNTVKAMQKHFGTYQDGIVSPVSDMVKAMQRALNQNKF